VNADLARAASLLPRLDAVDGQLRRCHEELRATPLRIEAEDSTLQLLRDELKDTGASLAAAESRLGGAQTALASLERRLDRARGRVASLVSAEQIEATEREIASLESQCSDGETEVLEGMEAAESLEGRQQVLEQQLQAGDSAQGNRQAEWAERSGELQVQVTTLDASRVELASGVRDDVLRLYEAALGRGPFGGSEASGITFVDSRFICATCHARVPPAWVQEARNHRSVQTCDGCRRLLVLPASPASSDPEPTGPDREANSPT